jgi:hypothetical protein
MTLATFALFALLARPESQSPIPVQTSIHIPPSDDSVNMMFVETKGNREYKILSPVQFQKELNHCIMLHADFFDTDSGPLVVLRCEEK